MFITFYSYKGGVGRTLALANIACILAEDDDHPQKVLLWDFDLEAPGLRRLFPPKSPHVRGFVELVHDYAKDLNVPDVSKYIYRSHIPGVDVLDAGVLDQTYCAHLQQIDWSTFFSSSPTDAGPFFTQITSQIRSYGYDYILIDSRTGLSDQAGICTQILSDLLVLVFRLTDQNLDGLEYLVPTLRSELASRGRSQVKLVPIASEVPSNSSAGILERRTRALDILGENELNYIRFDSDLIADETLLCLKSAQIDRWPIPPIIDDYKSLCDQLRKLNSQDTRTAMELLHSKMWVEDSASALNVLTTLLERRPRLAQLWTSLRTLSNQAQLQRQLITISQKVDIILERDPANVFACEYKADRQIDAAISFKDSKVEKAKQLIEQAIKYSNVVDTAHLQRRLAEVESCLGELDSAITTFRKSMAHPHQPNAQTQIDLAQLYIRKGESYYGSAVEALEEFPADVISGERLVLLTYLYAALGKAQIEEDAYEAFSKMQEKHSEWRVIINAHRHLMRGNIDRAKGILAEANIDEVTQVGNLAEFYICAGEMDAAIEIATKYPANEHGTKVALLARYLKGDDQIKMESLLKEWPGTWGFTELLFFRERVKRSAQYSDRLGIIDQLVQQVALYKLRSSRELSRLWVTRKVVPPR